MKQTELEKLFAACGLGQAYVEQEALFLWPEVVGPRLARLSQAQAVSEGYLYVGVGHHAFAHECTLMRDQWLQRLNARLRRPLKDIRFKVMALKAPPQPAAPPKLAEVSLDEREVLRIETLVQGVEDESLRRALRALFETYARREKIHATLPGKRRCPRCGLHHPGPEEQCSFCRIERGIL
ncbi:MAG TPA: DUF721 domain-containing protein [Candidatus Bipolaricaulota bacterium]